MVISFEEKDRAVIEAKGMTIIEFKRIFYQRAKIIGNAWSTLLDFADRFVKAWAIVKNKISEALDNVRLLFEEISEYYPRPTSARYKLVKVISKCTGIEKRDIWKITRHLYLRRARSCC